MKYSELPDFALYTAPCGYAMTSPEQVWQKQPRTAWLAGSDAVTASSNPGGPPSSRNIDDYFAAAVFRGASDGWQRTSTDTAKSLCGSVTDDFDVEVVDAEYGRLVN